MFVTIFTDFKTKLFFENLTYAVYYVRICPPFPFSAPPDPFISASFQLHVLSLKLYNISLYPSSDTHTGTHGQPASGYNPIRNE